MGCVHTRTRTFYSFPYQNSEEGLSTNNLSSTTLGLPLPGQEYQITCGDISGENKGLRKGTMFNIEETVQLGNHHQSKSFGRIGSLSTISSLREARTIAFLDTSKRRNFFYRSKSDDRQQFGGGIDFLDTNNDGNSKHKRHHRSENQLPVKEN
jgi:hypothetical protein